MQLKTGAKVTMMLSLLFLSFGNLFLVSSWIPIVDKMPVMTETIRKFCGNGTGDIVSSEDIGGVETCNKSVFSWFPIYLDTDSKELYYIYPFDISKSYEYNLDGYKDTSIYLLYAILFVEHSLMTVLLIMFSLFFLVGFVFYMVYLSKGQNEDENLPTMVDGNENNTEE